MALIVAAARDRRQGAVVVTPTAPPQTGLVRSWRADSVTGVADGGAVNSITFSGGLVLNGSTSKPTYQSAGLGGKPAVRFTRASQQKFTSATSPATVAQPVTVVLVLTPTLLTSEVFETLEALIHGGTEVALENGFDSWTAWGGASGLTGAIKAVKSQPVLIEATFNGASSRLAINGTQDIAGAAAGGGLDGALVLGSSGTARYFDGFIAEVLEYSQVLTTQQRTDLASYVQARYGITVAGAVAGGGSATAPGSVVGPVPTSNVPGVPTSVTVASDASGQATIRWQPPASNGGSAISGWLLGRDGNSASGEAPWSAVFDDPAMREATFYNLAPAQTYNVYVAAVNGAGTGPSVSKPIVPNGGTTTAAQPLIAPPATFELTAVAGGFTYDHEDVTVPAGATLGYYERRVGTTNPPTGTPVSTGGVSGGTVGSLPASAHYLQVRAVNTNGQPGNWSTVQGPVTPLATTILTPVVTVSGRRLQHPFWSTPLAADTPLASTSSNYVSRLAAQAAMGPGTNPGIPYGHPYNHETSVGNYSLPIYQMPAGWARQPVWHTRTRAGDFQEILDRGVPVPNPAHLADGDIAPKGTDGALIIFDPATRELWEFWQWRPSTRGGYTWEAEQGGYIRNIDKHPGWWAGSSWYGGGDGVRVNGYDWGVSACGQSYLGSLLTGEDFHGSAITHPLSLGLPITGPASGGPTHLLPASRYDWLTFGTGSVENVRLPEGARFRLPHSFNIAGWVSANARPQADLYGTTAAVLTKLLVCLRDYGVFIGESAGVVQLMGEHEKTYGTQYNPYTAGQKPQWGNLGQAIPWSSLVQIAPPTVDISVPGAGPA